MAKLTDKAKRMPSFENTFRNLNLNQRVSTVSTFVSADTWKESGLPAERPDGLFVYLKWQHKKRIDKIVQ